MFSDQHSEITAAETCAHDHIDNDINLECNTDLFSNTTGNHIMNVNAQEFTPMPVSQTQPTSYMEKLEESVQYNYEDLSDEDEEDCNDHVRTDDYRVKIKTELCKFWKRGEQCPFIGKCAFAHGKEELKKKVHVTQHYRQTLCHSYHKPGYYCLYGERCQFAHLKYDFSDFHQMRTPYQNLLKENTDIMTQRLEQAENPDITLFNVAMTSKPRLQVFQDITVKAKKAKKTDKVAKASYKKKQAKCTKNPIFERFDDMRSDCDSMNFNQVTF